MMKHVPIFQNEFYQTLFKNCLRMKNNKWFLVIKNLNLAITMMIILGSLSPLFLSGQEKNTIPENIINATKNADSKGLAVYFNEKIELIIPGKSGVYSKAQAEQVIKNFFETHPVTSFEIIHHGIKDNSAYAIGKYISNKIHYRFYYRTQESEGKILIHQLWIENQDE